MEATALMRVEEVASTLCLSKSNTYKLISEGKIPSVRIGNAVRVVRADLAKWIAMTAGPREVA